LTGLPDDRKNRGRFPIPLEQPHHSLVYPLRACNWKRFLQNITDNCRNLKVTSAATNQNLASFAGFHPQNMSIGMVSDGFGVPKTVAMS